MGSYTIDGLTYTDKLPHSRIERTAQKILDGNHKKPNHDDNTNDTNDDQNNDPNG